MTEDEDVIRIDVPVSVEVVTEHQHGEEAVTMTKRTDVPDEKEEAGRFGWHRQVYQCPRCGTRITVDISTAVDVTTTLGTG